MDRIHNADLGNKKEFISGKVQKTKKPATGMQKLGIQLFIAHSEDLEELVKTGSNSRALFRSSNQGESQPPEEQMGQQG